MKVNTKTNILRDRKEGRREMEGGTKKDLRKSDDDEKEENRNRKREWEKHIRDGKSIGIVQKKKLRKEIKKITD